MAAQVDICNYGLTLIGAGRITALTDNSKAARAMNAIYSMTRQAELRKFTWNFALKRASLPALASPPDWGFGSQYQLPTDFLRLVQAGDIYAVPSLDNYVNADNSNWAIEGQNILTDMGGPLKIRYVYNVTDEGLFDALFNISLAAQLSFATCEEITGSNTKKDVAMQTYKQAITDALRANAIERPPVSTAGDSWLIGRL